MYTRYDIVVFSYPSEVKPVQSKSVCLPTISREYVHVLHIFYRLHDKLQASAHILTQTHTHTELHQFPLTMPPLSLTLAICTVQTLCIVLAVISVTQCVCTKRDLEH